MSRIQDILAKAERDGTARVTRPAGTATATAAAVVSRMPVAPAPPPFEPTLVSSQPAAAATAAAPVTDVEQTRTARPTLHHSLVSAIAPHSTVAERYRAIRARVAHREEHLPLRILGVTSPGEGEGKSVTAANLALTMAQEFQRSVLLVDADLRNPAVHSLFGIDAGPGLNDVLGGDVPLDDALVYLPELRLTVLTAGSTAEYPAELLGSAAMRRTLDALRTRFDRVVVDLPPVLPYADVGTVAPTIDGAVMVVRAGVTQRPLLDEALAVLDEQKVLGIVLNDAN